MKIIFVLLIGFLSLNSFANNLEKFKTDILQMTAYRCTSDIASQTDRREVQVAFLRGSPIDAMNAPQAGEDFLNLTKSVLESKNFQVQTMSAHHTSWQSICDQFKARPQAHVILVGHSYGSSGALKVANCLAESGIKTDMLITVSSFDFLAGVDVSRIPEHVENHVNFSVSDPLISGYKQHTAINPERTQVSNVEAKIVNGGWAHLAAAGELLPLLSLVSTAQLEGKSAAVNMGSNVNSEVVNSNLNKYWNCNVAALPEAPAVPEASTVPEEPIAPTVDAPAEPQPVVQNEINS